MDGEHMAGRPNRAKWARAKRSLAVVAQVAGSVFVLEAVAHLASPHWALLAAGVMLVAYGTLSEAGWL